MTTHEISSGEMHYFDRDDDGDLKRWAETWCSCSCGTFEDGTWTSQDATDGLAAIRSNRDRAIDAHLAGGVS